MSNAMLLDGYKKTGTGYSSFIEEFCALGDTINIVRATRADITLLSLCKIQAYQRKGKAIFYVLDADSIEAFLENGTLFPIGGISEYLFSPETLKELWDTTGLMLIIKDEKYIMSNSAINSFSRWVGIGGDKMSKRQNICRDAHLADAILNSESRKPLYFITREAVVGNDPNGKPVVVKKIMATVSEDYIKESPELLSSVLKRLVKKGEIGKCSVYRWEITQKYSDIHVDFPILADVLKQKYNYDCDFVPGLYFRTSDIGASSFCVRSVIRKGKQYIVLDEKSFRHIKEYEPDEIMDAILSMYEGYEWYAESISLLNEKKVIDYSKVDLTSESGCVQNYEVIRDFFLNIIEKTYRKVKFSKKKKMSVTTLMEDSINSSVEYSLGMIADEIFSLPDYFSDIDEFTVTEIRRIVPQVVSSLVKTTDLVVI